MAAAATYPPCPYQSESSPTPSSLDLSPDADEIKHHPHNSPNLQLNLSIWLLAGLAAVFLGLRIWCKVRRQRRLWWDDHLLVASWVCLFVGCLLQSADRRLGYGLDDADLAGGQLVRSGLISQIAGFFLILAAAWSKTSFALTLLRISSGWVKKTVWSVILSVNIVIGVSIGIHWFWCWPSVHIWDQAVSATCMPREAVNGYNMAAAGYSGGMDILLAILPWKIVWPLTMNKKEKFGVAFAMSIGVFAGITSFLKIPAILAVDRPGIAHVIDLMVLGTAEGAVTIIAASIPIMRHLFRSSSGPRSGMLMPWLKADEVGFARCDASNDAWLGQRGYRDGS